MDIIIILFIYFIFRSSGGAKGDSESEADPFVQHNITNFAKYEHLVSSYKYV